MTRFDTFLASYLEAAAFADAPEGQTDLPFDGPSKLQAEKDCKAFLDKNYELIGDKMEQAGHDFWLTRNRHGAGFWDHPEMYGAEQAKALTEAAHAFGESHIEVKGRGKTRRLYFY